jgi:hypothetical protein
LSLASLVQIELANVPVLDKNGLDSSERPEMVCLACRNSGALKWGGLCMVNSQSLGRAVADDWRSLRGCLYESYARIEGGIELFA